MNGPTPTPIENAVLPKTVVSTDVTTEPIVAARGNVILIPMSEWKQSAQRGARTFLQAFLFLGGGGTVYSYLTNLGIPPASAANLPSAGHPLADAFLYALVFGLIVLVWNAVEFALDIDLKAPKWRA